MVLVIINKIYISLTKETFLKICLIFLAFDNSQDERVNLFRIWTTQ